MYSPKISEELIPRIYEEAKARNIKMTALVNEILRKELNKRKDKNEKQISKLDSVIRK